MRSRSTGSANRRISHCLVILVAVSGCRGIISDYPCNRIPAKFPPHNELGSARTYWSQDGTRIYYTGSDGVRGTYGMHHHAPQICSVNTSPPYENRAVGYGSLAGFDREVNKVAGLRTAAGLVGGSVSHLEKKEYYIASSERGDKLLSLRYPPDSVEKVVKGPMALPGMTRALLLVKLRAPEKPEEASERLGRMKKVAVQRYAWYDLIEWDLLTGSTRPLKKVGVWGVFGGYAGQWRLVSTVPPEGGEKLFLYNVDTNEECAIADGIPSIPKPYAVGSGDGWLSQDMHFAFLGVYKKGGAAEIWMIRLADLRAVRIARTMAVTIGSLSPDGNKLCVRLDRSVYFWWRGLWDEYPYNHGVPRLFVIDISRAYEDIDGPDSFDVRKVLGGEWHPLGVKGTSDLESARNTDRVDERGRRREK